jgi:hypothetical protein
MSAHVEDRSFMVFQGCILDEVDKIASHYPLVAGTTSITRVAPILSSFWNGWSELKSVQKLNTRDKLIGTVALLSRYGLNRV